MINPLSKEGFLSQAPRVPPELVAYLNQTFPEKCADLGEDVSSIFHRAGQRSVVLYLIRLLEEQEDNVR